MSEPREIIVTVRSCQRCGHAHMNMRFAPLANAIDEWSWWALCPITQQPVLLCVVDDKQEKTTA